MMRNSSKKKLYIISSICMMLVFTIGLTFAYFSYRKKGTEIALSSGNSLNIVFSSQNSFIEGSGLAAVSDTFGKSSPNKVEIELKGYKPSLYNDVGFNIEIVPIEQGKAYTSTSNQLDISKTNVSLDKVKAYLTSNTALSHEGLTEVEILTDLEKNPETGGYILYKNQFVINGLSQKNYAVRVWLDESVNEKANLDFKVAVYAYNKEAKSYKTLEKLGLTDLYDGEFGSSSRCGTWPTNAEGKVLYTNTPDIEYNVSSKLWKGYYTANFIEGSKNSQHVYSVANKRSYAICSKEDDDGLSYYPYGMTVSLDMNTSTSKTFGLIRINGDGSIRVSDYEGRGTSLYAYDSIDFKYPNSSNDSDYSIKYIRPTAEEAKANFLKMQEDFNGYKENYSTQIGSTNPGTFAGYRVIIPNPGNNYFSSMYELDYSRTDGYAKLINREGFSSAANAENKFVILTEGAEDTTQDDLFYIYKALYSGSALEVYGMYANKEFNESDEVLEAEIEKNQDPYGTTPIVYALMSYFTGDSWLSTYSHTVYDTVYCSDRTTSDESLDHSRNPIIPQTYKMITKYPIGDSIAMYGGYIRYFSKRNTAKLTCLRKVDRFTVSDEIGNGSLTRPVGLVTIDEIALNGFNNRAKAMAENWTTKTFKFGEANLSYKSKISTGYMDVTNYSNFGGVFGLKDYRTNVNFDDLSGLATMTATGNSIGTTFVPSTRTSSWGSGYVSSDSNTYTYLDLGSEMTFAGSAYQSFINQSWTMSPAYGDNVIYFNGATGGGSNLSKSSSTFLKRYDESGQYIPVISLNPDYFTLSNSSTNDATYYYQRNLTLNYVAPNE